MPRTHRSGPLASLHRAGFLVAIAAVLATLVAAGPAHAATITPDVTTDELAANSDCSLREAVRIANVDNPAQEPACDVDGSFGPAIADTIQLGNGTYALSLAGSTDDTASTGDLDLLDADGVAIAGLGSGATTIDGGGVDRVFDAIDGLLQVSDVTVTGGAAPVNGDGGGILVRAGGNLALSDSAIDSNTATADNTADGGGISFQVAHSGTATIERTRITNNVAGALGDGGGIHASSPGSPTIAITDSDIGMNGALRGGGIWSVETASIADSLVRDNDAEETTVDAVPGGGGVDNGTGAVLEVLRSAISGNTVTSVDVNGNGGQAIGGGVRTIGAEVSIRDSAITGNDIVNTGAGLQQQFGGGLANVNGGGATIVNSTISGNSAPAASAAGGGVYAAVNTDVIASTIADNAAGGPQGDAITWQASAGAFVVKSSILTGPSAGSVCSFGAGDSLTSLGYNVALGASCVGLTGTGDAPNTDPALAPRADNGAAAVGAPGFTAIPQTHAIAAGTPAADRVPLAQCVDQDANQLAVDQRGFERPSPSGGSCDSGAFELAQAGQPGTGTPGITTPLVSAPPNAFDFGKFKRKKKKGIGFLIVFVPGPGEVGLAGKGIKNRGFAARARRSISTDGGRVKLKVTPTKNGKGKKIRNRLRSKGNAKAKVRVSYLPSGGTINTRSRKLKLIRR